MISFEDLTYATHGRTCLMEKQMVAHSGFSGFSIGSGLGGSSDALYYFEPKFQDSERGHSDPPNK